MPTFAEEHKRRMQSMDARAQAAGSNMTEVCRNTELARATYERWMVRPPQSITKLDLLEKEIERLEELQRNRRVTPGKAAAAQEASSQKNDTTSK